MGIGGAGEVASLRVPAPREYSESFRRRFLMAMVIAWMIPIQLNIAGQRMDPYRILLILSFIPFVAGIWSGRAGRVIPADWLVLGFGLWMVITFLIHHGASMLSFGASLALESVGGYLVGRVIVRNLGDLRAYIRYFLVALLFLAPFVAMELVRGNSVIADFFGRFFPVPEKLIVWRHGFARVQAVFPHPILYGLFCAMHLALVLYIYRENIGRLLPRLGFVIVMSLASLSSAPMLSLAMQAFAVGWGYVTGNRWRLLVGLSLGLIVFLHFASNRGPALILIETMTLDPTTGWYRYFIWVYVIENIKTAPMFGLGMNDWARPGWMHSGSVDSYWLVIALRHGLPALVMLLVAFGTHLYRLVRVTNLLPEARVIRDGYVISFVGLCFILTTVHIWGSVSVVVMFFLGAGSFFYTSPSVLSPPPGSGPADHAPTDAEPHGQRRLAYSRNLPKNQSKLPSTRFNK